MWLGDQITSKGIGNGVSVIIFAGIVVSLPNQITTAFQKWILASWSLGSNEASLGVFRFILYILALLAIIAFVTFIELSKRKIPVQHAVFLSIVNNQIMLQKVYHTIDFFLFIKNIFLV